MNRKLRQSFYIFPILVVLGDLDMVSDLKREIIRLLKEDEEFRYTVAGLIGLQEMLERLNQIGEEQKRLREDFNKLHADFNKNATRDTRT